VIVILSLLLLPLFGLGLLVGLVGVVYEFDRRRRFECRFKFVASQDFRACQLHQSVFSQGLQRFLAFRRVSKETATSARKCVESASQFNHQLTSAGVLYRDLVLRGDHPGARRLIRQYQREKERFESNLARLGNKLQAESAGLDTTESHLLPVILEQDNVRTNLDEYFESILTSTEVELSVSSEVGNELAEFEGKLLRSVDSSVDRVPESPPTPVPKAAPAPVEARPPSTPTPSTARTSAPVPRAEPASVEASEQSRSQRLRFGPRR
jgi:hypothetical protein